MCKPGGGLAKSGGGYGWIGGGSGKSLVGEMLQSVHIREVYVFVNSAVSKACLVNLLCSSSNARDGGEERAIRTNSVSPPHMCSKMRTISSENSDMEFGGNK